MVVIKELPRRETLQMFTLSSHKERGCFILFQRGYRQTETEAEIDAYVGGYFTPDARHSGFNQAHFKAQHIYSLCICAPH